MHQVEDGTWPNTHVRWGVRDSEISIRTMEDTDAVALFHLWEFGIPGIMGPPPSMDACVRMITENRESHTPIVIREKKVICGPPSYHMVVCYQINGQSMVIGTCGFEQVRKEVIKDKAERIGYMVFYIAPNLEVGLKAREIENIRDSVVRCLLTFGFSFGNHSGMHLDRIRIANLDEAYTDVIKNYLHLQKPRDGVDGIGGYSEARRTNWYGAQCRLKSMDRHHFKVEVLD